MFNKLKCVVVTISAALLVACGGGDSSSSPDYYGAVAVNRANGQGGITANYTSQADANRVALSNCGSGCEIAEQFHGAGLCAALAVGTNAWGSGQGSTKQNASDRAVADCSSVGGKACAAVLAKCNG